ncbi:MAG: hypothetical protein IJL78_10765 [Lachnospiraceae bacterium]|nr:hypothetical protein [Lachnospiraceae bacterium]
MKRRETNTSFESRGEELIRTYIASGLVSFPNDDLVLENGLHVIRGLTLSPEIQDDEARMETFRADLRELVELMVFTGADPRLSIPRARIRGRLWPYLRNEAADGISLLLLFAEGLLYLSRKDQEETDLYAENLLLTGIPDAESVLTALAEDIVTYGGGKPARVQILPFTRSRTEHVPGGLSVTYYLDDEFESRFGTGAPSAVPDRDLREGNAERNRQKTLSILRDMLKKMEKTPRE